MSVRLVPVTPTLAQLALLRPDLAAPGLRALGLVAAPGWPHAGTADVVRPIAEHGPAVGSFLAVLAGVVIGECGWLGGPDEAGDVEIGYGVAPSRRRQGLGLAMLGELGAGAAQQPGGRRVCAEALVGNEASCRLLLRAGFARADGARLPYVRFHLPVD